MWATRKDVGRKRGGPFDGHGLLAAEFKQGNFCGQRAGQGLRVSDQTGGGERKVVADLEELLDALVGNEMAHRSPMVSADNNTSLEGDTDCACSGLHDGLVF